MPLVTRSALQFSFQCISYLIYAKASHVKYTSSPGVNVGLRHRFGFTVLYKSRAPTLDFYRTQLTSTPIQLPIEINWTTEPPEQIATATCSTILCFSCFWDWPLSVCARGQFLIHSRKASRCVGILDRWAHPFFQLAFAMLCRRMFMIMMILFARWRVRSEMMMMMIMIANGGGASANEGTDADLGDALASWGRGSPSGIVMTATTVTTVTTVTAVTTATTAIVIKTIGIAVAISERSEAKKCPLVLMNIKDHIPPGMTWWFIVSLDLGFPTA